MTHRLFHVDAFTDEPYRGNPAGVVIGPPLPPASMQRIARELNLSETAFPATPVAAGVDLRIRWFTPTSEVAFCGHATVATFHVLRTAARDFLASGKPWPALGETGEAVLAVGGERLRVGLRGDGEILLETPREDFHPLRNADVEALLPALGLGPGDLARDLPIERSDSGDTMIPLRTLEALRRARPDVERLLVLDREIGVLGHTLLTAQTIDIVSRVHVRFFGPSVGVFEDPVTGSANGLVGRYLVRHDVVQVGCERGATSEYIAEQGDHLGRRGRLRVRLERAIDVPAAAAAPPSSLASYVGGRAVTIFAADLPVP